MHAYEWGGPDEMTKNCNPKVLLKVQSTNANHKNCSRIRRNSFSMVSSLNRTGWKERWFFCCRVGFSTRSKHNTSFTIHISTIPIDSHFCYAIVSLFHHSPMLFLAIVLINFCFVWWCKSYIRFWNVQNYQIRFPAICLNSTKFIGFLFNFDAVPFSSRMYS